MPYAVPPRPTVLSSSAIGPRWTITLRRDSADATSLESSLGSAAVGIPPEAERTAEDWEAVAFVDGIESVLLALYSADALPPRATLTASINTAVEAYGNNS